MWNNVSTWLTSSRVDVGGAGAFIVPLNWWYKVTLTGEEWQ